MHAKNSKSFSEFQIIEIKKLTLKNWVEPDFAAEQGSMSHSFPPLLIEILDKSLNTSRKVVFDVDVLVMGQKLGKAEVRPF